MNEKFSPQDYKYIASAEGERLTESYEWFKDPEVIGSYIDSCKELISDGEVTPEAKSSLNILGIGSGTGNLEQQTAEMLRSKGFFTDLFITDLRKLYEDREGGNEMPDKVFEFNKSHPIGSPHGDTYMYGQENKSMAVSSNYMDLVLARSVTHYEKTQELERKVLSEVLRVLKPGGYFIDQAPSIPTRSEADLIKEIHMFLPKEMNIQTKEETKAMLEEFFEVSEANAEHQPKPLATDRDSFIKRYTGEESKLEEITKRIVELINAVPVEERPNVWLEQETGNFGWNIPFTIYKCKKPVNKERSEDEV